MGYEVLSREELVNKNGLRIRTVDIFEARKAEVGITCSSVIFAHEVAALQDAVGARLAVNERMFSAPKIGLLLVATCCALVLENSAHGDQAFDVVNATYNTGAEVPISSDGFTALGKTVNLRLNYAPAAGTQLTVVKNKGPGMIRGTFRNLAQGQIVGLSYGGITYNFVANYRGGKGNDLVLLWTTGEEQLPAATGKKLDDQILLALKQSRGQPPFDKPTSLQPVIPCKDGTSVLVDVDATVSADLVTHIALIGGKVAMSPDRSRIIRAMIPLSQLEALSWRADVKSISAARPTVTSIIKP